jgi:hypothetical protein
MKTNCLRITVPRRRWDRVFCPIAIVVAASFLAASCGEWVPLGPGPRIQIESDPPGAVVTRNDEEIGKAPMVDDLSTTHELREYRRSGACYPAAIAATAALLGASVALVVIGSKMGDRSQSTAVESVGGGISFAGTLLVGAFAIGGCADRPRDGAYALLSRGDSEKPLSFNYSAALFGHKKSRLVQALSDQKEPIRLFLPPDPDSKAAPLPQIASLPAPAAVPEPKAPAGPPALRVAIQTAPAFQPGVSRTDAFALVVGIERYRDLPSPSGARNDAQSFAKLAGSTLGIPERNIRMLLDERATRSDITRETAWLQANVPPGGRIFFYFSGHGTPELKSGDSLLLPYDANAEAGTQTGLSLPVLLAGLSDSQARDVVAIVDSCFSGSGRSVLPAGARPLVPVKVFASPAKAALFSATAAGETSGNGEGNEPGGLFTHFVLEGLGHAQADIDGDGAVSLKELADWVTPRVTREARRQNRAQNPTLTVGASLGSAPEVILTRGIGEH